MDQVDFRYDDFVDETPPGKRKPIFLILMIVLVILLLGAGGFVLWSRPELLSFLAQLGTARTDPTGAIPTAQPLATEAAAISSPTPQKTTATPLLATETPVDAALESLLPLPGFGRLLQTGAGTKPDQEERVVKLANEMAIREPFQWEQLEFDSETVAKDVERYYIQLVNQDMGFLMTFNEKYPEIALTIFKFKQDKRRVTIQFYDRQQDNSPTAYLFYEGW